MPGPATSRNRKPPPVKSTSVPVPQRSTKQFAGKRVSSHRPRVQREEDEDIVRPAHSDVESDDDSVSSAESSVVSMPERTVPASHNKPQRSSVRATDTKPSATSNAVASNDNVMQFNEDSPGRALLTGLQEAWSDMVPDTDSIPVVDFNQVHTISQPDPADAKSGSSSRLGTSNQRGKEGVKRPAGVSVRQAYMDRLETDPSYIPRVGKFWGHDERLLDKDLRSLSGWWRGKWNGRGGFLGRGRGGYSGRGGRVAGPSNVADRTEQNWRHDGFDELKDNESESTSTLEPKPGRGSFWGHNSHGRGRGRGSAPRTSEPLAPATPIQEKANSDSTPPPKRSWFRYEYAWTKHSSSFLFNDGFSRPRNGENLRLRVKLPGQARYTVTRLQEETKAEAESKGQTPLDRSIIVKLPGVQPRLTSDEDDKGTTSIGFLTPEDAHTRPEPPVEDLAASLAAAIPPSPEKSQGSVNVPPVPLIPESQAKQASSSSPSAPSTESQSHEQQFQPPIAPNPNHGAQGPSYSSPIYGPSPFPYPIPHPPPHPSVPEHLWYDPRTPYGYPTPPPQMPPSMFTPPVQSNHQPQPHHHHSHSQSLSIPPTHPMMISPGPHNVNPYFNMPMQGGPLPPMPPPTDQPRGTSQVTYDNNGTMIDPTTGKPMFSLAKAKVKIAIRRPDDGSGQSPSSAPAPSETTTSSTLGPNTSSNPSVQSLPIADEKPIVTTTDVVGTQHHHHHHPSSSPDFGVPQRGYAVPMPPQWNGFHPPGPYNFVGQYHQGPPVHGGDFAYPQMPYPPMGMQQMAYIPYQDGHGYPRMEYQDPNGPHVFY